MFNMNIYYLKCLLISQVIGKARVPIIKFVEKRSGIAFDIRFTCLFFVLDLKL
jgi:DNA polymerase sigma